MPSHPKKPKYLHQSVETPKGVRVGEILSYLGGKSQHGTLVSSAELQDMVPKDESRCKKHPNASG